MVSEEKVEEGKRSSAKRISSSPDFADGNGSDNDIARPELVVAKGYGLSTGLTNQPNIFTLDATHAGNGDFDVVVKGESRATIEYEEETEALYKVKYFISSPGDYTIDVKYDNQHIPGSPFSTKILDPTSHSGEQNSSNTQETGSIDSFSTSHEMSEDEVLSQASRKLPIEARVITPSGRLIYGVISKNSSGKINVKFPREEIGSYKISIHHIDTGEQLQGSPYEVIVKSQKSTRQKVAGPVIQQTKLGDNQCFSIIGTKGININNLFIAVIGPSHVKLRVYQHLETLDVIYDVRRKGTYTFYVQECQRKLSGSPFEVKLPHENTADNKKDNFVSLITATVWHGFDASFQEIKTRINSPNGNLTPHSSSRKGRHLVEIKFLPNIAGSYVLNCSFADDIFEDFTITVDNIHDQKDFLKITGEGLKAAYVNETAMFRISAKHISARSFSIEFDGPEKVDIKQEELSNGEFLVQYIGNRAGKYILSIKYDGIHIGCSPYEINILDKRLRSLTTESEFKDQNERISSNPNLCRAYGEGLKFAKCGEMCGFKVDAFKAGSGSLMAGFVDSRRSVLTEVICKHVGNCVYDVKYKLDYPGKHKLTVLWAGSHIPGSPFTVEVRDENNNS